MVFQWQDHPLSLFPSSLDGLRGRGMSDTERNQMSGRLDKS